ncbi:hypothetical protein Slin14017_G017850 [Septoria linicola]|nr:hypothetical protein Slin14017_G017850 [Septoria linicola]
MHVNVFVTACLWTSASAFVWQQKRQLLDTAQWLNSTLTATTVLLNTTLTSNATTTLNLTLASNMTTIECPPLSPIKTYIAQVNASLWALSRMQIYHGASWACRTQEFSIPCEILFDSTLALNLVCAEANGTGLYQVANAHASWYIDQAISDMTGLYNQLQVMARNGTRPSLAHCQNLPWDTMIRSRINATAITRLLCGSIADPFPGYREDIGSYTHHKRLSYRQPNGSSSRPTQITTFLSQINAALWTISILQSNASTSVTAASICSSPDPSPLPPPSNLFNQTLALALICQSATGIKLFEPKSLAQAVSDLHLIAGMLVDNTEPPLPEKGNYQIAKCRSYLPLHTLLSVGIEAERVAGLICGVQFPPESSFQDQDSDDITDDENGEEEEEEESISSAAYATLATQPWSSEAMTSSSTIGGVWTEGREEVTTTWTSLQIASGVSPDEVVTEMPSRLGSGERKARVTAIAVAPDATSCA